MPHEPGRQLVNKWVTVAEDVERVILGQVTELQVVPHGETSALQGSSATTGM